jgi:signal transduction histidine kinase
MRALPRRSTAAGCLDPSLTRGVGGSGLGLYISREPVERMHGRLTVASEPARASTFSVELPVA